MLVLLFAETHCGGSTEEDGPGKYSFFSTSQRCLLNKKSCGSPVLGKLLAKEVQYSYTMETACKWPDSDTINPFRIMIDSQQGVGVYFANSMPNSAETRHRGLSKRRPW